MSDEKIVHLNIVGKTLDEAGPPPEDAGEARVTETGGRRKGPPRNEDGLPEGCPVRPLGRTGDTYCYLDEGGQYRELKAKDHGRTQIMALFGDRTPWLYDTWPRTDKDGNVTGWRPERACEELMRACARKPIWNASDQVRAAGAWRGRDDELVWHCGDAVVIIRKEGWQVVEPGLVAGGVYPASGALPRPEPGEPADTLALIDEVLADLSSWRWRRGERDARLLMGWIAAAHIAGALKWRPSCWLTGGAGTGKSSLQDYVRGIFDGAIVRAESASPAAIWQTLGRRSLPCAFDELEPDADNPKRVQGLIDLARISASGGEVRRGSNDHSPVLFTLRSSFLFSSILVPPMSSADRTRLAILELDSLPAGQAPPDLGQVRLRRLGGAIRSRLAAGWHRLDALVERIRAGLVQRGHSARGADQFGMLLACADIVLEDQEPDTDSLEELLDAYRLEELVEVAADTPSPDRCLMHLLSSIIDPYRSGGRKTVGEWIEDATQVKAALGGEEAWERAEAARKALATHGMRIMLEDGEPRWLAVANCHQGVAKLFENTHWAGRSGADGVWPQELRRIEGHMVAPRPVRFAGMLSRAVLVPLARVRGGEEYET